MCTELPVELAEVRPDATARGWVGGRAAGRPAEVSLVLLDGPALRGDWVVAHAGFALHRISAAAAREALSIHAYPPPEGVDGTATVAGPDPVTAEVPPRPSGQAPLHASAPAAQAAHRSTREEPR